MDQAARFIRIRGARVHNLQNISLDLPRERLVVITGPSGSGKSSLAFDTLYAEGQRRYVESLSAYARQFLERMAKPEVDSIDGLSPAIAIEQKSVGHNPRSTVGTVTEIYDYLRLLYARLGQPHCPRCGRPISAQTVSEMVERLLAVPEGTRFQLLAPVLRDRKSEGRRLFDELRRAGFTRALVDGRALELESADELDGRRKHTVEVIVDRLVARADQRSRLHDSLETALRLADGLVVVDRGADGRELLSERHTCPVCGLGLPELSPRLFSFNNPHGACPTCDGLGVERFIDPARVVPEPSLSLAEGALVPWARGGYYGQMLGAVAEHYGFDLQRPFARLAERARQIVLFGSGEERIRFHLASQGMSHTFQRPFEGVIPNLQRRYRETTSEAVRAELESYMARQPCPACGGARLRPEALAVRLGGRSIAGWTCLTARAAREELAALELPTAWREVGERILREVDARLRFLIDVGLDYLTLDRASATLAGGEGQRIRLATQIGSALTGVLYVLDEPTIGLHPRDCRRLLDTLIELRDRGNTLVVVEHDPDTIRRADWVVDMGPRAGRQGGRVVAEGTPEAIAVHPDSLTGAYLSGRLSIPVPTRRRRARGELTLRGARGHNLQELTVKFPLGVFTCVTGVSGSGKSTLVIDTLYRALAAKLHGAAEAPAPYGSLAGMAQLDKVVHIDQRPIGRTPRSNPATYTGLFTGIRELFSGLPESRVRGWGAGRFSFNVKGGRCESCGGGGQVKIEMHFLPDVFVPCEACGARRFNAETLQVTYRGLSIDRVLELTVNEALAFFEAHAALRRRLQTLADVGLGYLSLGQSATTLSGGEAQRVKLSRELARRATGRTVVILDEPTVGLHPDDIRLLLGVLGQLVHAGNTVIVIEHNLDVIKQADHLIDLGPEGGEGGGRLVASGTPERVAANPASATGQALAPILGPAARTPRAGQGRRRPRASDR